MFIFLVKKPLGEVVGCWSSFIDAESQLKSLKGGEIEKYAQDAENAHRDVFRANVEADSRLGMGSLVDDSWDCWENKDYETNPNGSVS